MIIPLFKLAKNKGDRLWWVRCAGAGSTDPNFRMTIPFGMTISTGTDPKWEGITLVKFYFLSLAFGFGYRKDK